MKKHTISLLVLLTLWAAAPVMGDAHDIIPCPNHIEESADTYRLKKLSVYIDNDERKEDLSAMLQLQLATPTGLPLRHTKQGQANLLFLSDATLGKDAYTLQVDKHGVTVRSSSYGGQFYALQTLLQLLPSEVKSPSPCEGVQWTLPYVSIQDAPRFGWRGAMLDVSRHWFTKEEVMRFIDEIAAYKFNIFHWHLTDDQGWRLQSDAYPRLQEIGSKRAFRVGDWWTYEPQQDGEEATYGGYYTKEEIRQVIAYAAQRNIAIMPEVDVPGHSQATLVCYPELACLNAPQKVTLGNKFYGIEENSLCAGSDATYEFLEKIFTEVAELFPFEYIHVGGDECYKGFWEKCPKCKQKMKNEQLAGTNELQSYLIRRVEKILHSHGKKMVGWDEILEGGLADDATVMSWRGTNGGITAAKAGHHVIMTPTDHCYLDLYQGEPSTEPCTYSMLRASSCYDWNPVPDGVNPSLVLGSQGNLWTESVPNFRHAEYMTWPRGWALAETMWTSPAHKDWMDFVRRMEHHFTRADKADINYAANSVYTPILQIIKSDMPEPMLELSSEIADVEMHYTFDGTLPDLHSPRYAKPLTIPRNASRLIVQSYRHGHKVGNLVKYELAIDPETKELRLR